MKLQGKTAIISGGGRGLGRASAVALAREGAAVVIIGRTAEQLHKTAATIMAAGGRALPVAGDVADPGVVRRVARAALDTFGSIDVLVNNAAIVGALRPLWQVEPEEWEQALDVDLKAPQLLCHAVAPQMVRQKRGKIINVTSGLGHIVMSPFGLYSIAKAGLDHMTRILAAELREHNVQVNGFDPGVMDTGMQEEIRTAGPQRLGRSVHAQFEAMKEQGLLAPAEQAARAVVFLASPESGGMTGEIGSARDFRRFGFAG